jgi:sugar phosphate permease
MSPAAPDIAAAPARPPAARLPWRIPLALGVTFFVHYLDRNIIAIALPAMGRDFGWSDRQLGAYGEWLLGAFFLTYGAAQMLLSAAAERFGPRRSLLVVVLAFSLVTIAMGLAGAAGGIAALIALRALLGLAESVHVPMMSAITARHFPEAVRARANSTWSVGLIVATALGPVLTVPIMVCYGWSAAFVVLGGVGLAFALPLLWWCVARDPGPGSNASSGLGLAPPAPTRTDWAFARRGDYRLYVACGVANAFCAFGILGWLPTYFSRAKGVAFEALGWPLAVVFTTGVVATLALAAFGDRLQRRVLPAAIGFAAAGLLCLAAIRAQGLVPLVVLFALAVAAQSAFTAQEYATVQRLAGDRHIGAATGLYNGVSLILGGVGGSLVPGAIVAATGSFDLALTSVAIGAAIASALCAVLAWRTRA